MSNFYMMVGMQASGKSHYAEIYAKTYNATIVSSDSIRKELFEDETYQGDNTQVFEVAHKRIKTLLQEGKNVVFDATNTNRKRRMHLINNEIKADHKYALYVATPFEECVKQDELRERSVGDEVITRTYKNLQIPSMGEGWDYVKTIYPEPESWNRAFNTMNFMDVLRRDMGYGSFVSSLTLSHIGFDKVIDLPHDSSYHVFSVGRHIYHAWKYAMENYNGMNKEEVLAACVFHDIGKAFCKSFIGTDGFLKRYANFYKHENVGAQIASIELYNLGFDDYFISNVVDLIQFHMDAHDMTDKKRLKLRRLLGDERFEDLVFLSEADRSGR